MTESNLFGLDVSIGEYYRITVSPGRYVGILEQLTGTDGSIQNRYTVQHGSLPSRVATEGGSISEVEVGESLPLGLGLGKRVEVRANGFVGGFVSGQSSDFVFALNGSKRRAGANPPPVFQLAASPNRRNIEYRWVAPTLLPLVTRALVDRG